MDDGNINAGHIRSICVNNYGASLILDSGVAVLLDFKVGVRGSGLGYRLLYVVRLVRMFK